MVKDKWLNHSRKVTSRLNLLAYKGGRYSERRMMEYPTIVKDVDKSTRYVDNFGYIREAFNSSSFNNATSFPLKPLTYDVYFSVDNPANDDSQKEPIRYLQINGNKKTRDFPVEFMITPVIYKQEYPNIVGIPWDNNGDYAKFYIKDNNQVQFVIDLKDFLYDFAVGLRITVFKWSKTDLESANLDLTAEDTVDIEFTTDDLLKTYECDDSILFDGNTAQLAYGLKTTEARAEIRKANQSLGVVYNNSTDEVNTVYKNVKPFESMFSSSVPNEDKPYPLDTFGVNCLYKYDDEILSNTMSFTNPLVSKKNTVRVTNILWDSVSGKWDKFGAFDFQLKTNSKYHISMYLKYDDITVDKSANTISLTLRDPVSELLAIANSPIIELESGKWQKVSYIKEWTGFNSATLNGIRLGFTGAGEERMLPSGNYSIAKISMVNLTDIYGAGNEPTIEEVNNYGAGDKTVFYKNTTSLPVSNILSPTDTLEEFTRQEVYLSVRTNIERIYSRIGAYILTKLDYNNKTKTYTLSMKDHTIKLDDIEFGGFHEAGYSAGQLENLTLDDSSYYAHEAIYNKTGFSALNVISQITLVEAVEKVGSFYTYIRGEDVEAFKRYLATIPVSGFNTTDLIKEVMNRYAEATSSFIKQEHHDIKERQYQYVLNESGELVDTRISDEFFEYQTFEPLKEIVGAYMIDKDTVFDANKRMLATISNAEPNDNLMIHKVSRDVIDEFNIDRERTNRINSVSIEILEQATPQDIVLYDEFDAKTPTGLSETVDNGYLGLNVKGKIGFDDISPTFNGWHPILSVGMGEVTKNFTIPETTWQKYKSLGLYTRAYFSAGRFRSRFGNNYLRDSAQIEDGKSPRIYKTGVGEEDYSTSKTGISKDVFKQINIESSKLTVGAVVGLNRQLSITFKIVDPNTRTEYLNQSGISIGSPLGYNKITQHYPALIYFQFLTKAPVFENVTKYDYNASIDDLKKVDGSVKLSITSNSLMQAGSVTENGVPLAEDISKYVLDEFGKGLRTATLRWKGTPKIRVFDRMLIDDTLWVVLGIKHSVGGGYSQTIRLMEDG